MDDESDTLEEHSTSADVASVCLVVVPFLAYGLAICLTGAVFSATAAVLEGLFVDGVNLLDGGGSSVGACWVMLDISTGGGRVNLALLDVYACRRWGRYGLMWVAGEGDGSSVEVSSCVTCGGVVLDMGGAKGLVELEGGCEKAVFDTSVDGMRAWRDDPAVSVDIGRGELATRLLLVCGG